MVSWWVTYSYFDNEQIKISDVYLMDPVYGSSGSFLSRVRSNIFYITHIQVEEVISVQN